LPIRKPTFKKKLRRNTVQFKIRLVSPKYIKKNYDPLHRMSWVKEEEHAKTDIYRGEAFWLKKNSDGRGDPVWALE